MSQDWRTSLPNNELGDFQTPASLARLIVERVGGDGWERIFEPTCGRGTFLSAALTLSPREMIGLELQSAYAQEARTISEVVEADIFDIDLSMDIPWKSRSGSLLCVGNPPWVTNSQLSSLGSTNVPMKRNIRGLRGIDAMTGASNFDIAEYIWLKLIIELAAEEPTIALLCKTSVARNVLTFAAQHQLPIARSAIHLIDAKEWFNVSVDACLFVLSIQKGAANYECEWYSTLQSHTASRRIGVVNGRLVSDIGANADILALDGSSPVEWRQGIKHDAASVMELLIDGDQLITRAGELVDIEGDYVFPLLKGTDIFRGRTLAASKRMLVTQRSLKDDPTTLGTRAPKVWRYLESNHAVLDGRMSSIYRNRPRFSIFGVGEYSFCPYKVVVSGLHKEARFRAVGPIEERAVVFDDTCYFVPVPTARQATALAAILNSNPCQNAIESLAFWDAKRPITKKLLQRLDLRAVVSLADADELAALAQRAYEEDLGQLAPGAPMDGLSELVVAWTIKHVSVQPAQQGSLFGIEQGVEACVGKLSGRGPVAR